LSWHAPTNTRFQARTMISEKLVSTITGRTCEDAALAQLPCGVRCACPECRPWSPLLVLRVPLASSARVPIASGCLRTLEPGHYGHRCENLWSLAARDRREVCDIVGHNGVSVAHKCTV